MTRSLADAPRRSRISYRGLQRHALLRGPDVHETPVSHVGVQSGTDQRVGILRERHAHFENVDTRIEYTADAPRLHPERGEGDDGHADQGDGQILCAGRHPDHHREDHKGGVLGIPDDRSKPDDRERAHKAEGARDVVADHLRHHRDEYGEEDQRRRERWRDFARPCAVVDNRDQPSEHERKDQTDDDVTPGEGSVGDGGGQKLRHPGSRLRRGESGLARRVAAVTACLQRQTIPGNGRRHHRLRRRTIPVTFS